MTGKKWILYGKQLLDADDLLSIQEVLNSTHLTQGPKVIEFEEALCNATDARFAACVNSGTSALHIACLTAGVGPGDEVLTTPNTFVASANCAIYCGAKPVFADIDPNTYNISPAAIERKISRKTRAVIPVHFAGQSCDMEEIRHIVTSAERKYGHKIFIIEDGCHALGSLYKNRKVGSCYYSDITVMSFHPVKHITTGEGGVAFTNDEGLRKKLGLLRSHGITSDPKEFISRDLAFQSKASDSSAKVNPWYYEQISVGFNYRITDIQCALGISQLKKLDRFCKRRREIVTHYNNVFRNVRHIRIPFEEHFNMTNFHLYVLLFDFKEIGIDRAQFMLRLRDKEIQTQVHYLPVHLHSYYRNHFETNWGDCPNAEWYYQKCLSIPLHPAMSLEDKDRVTNAILHIVKDQE